VPRSIPTAIPASLAAMICLLVFLGGFFKESDELVCLVFCGCLVFENERVVVTGVVKKMEVSRLF